MRLYIDSADRAVALDLLAVGAFHGVTTNPLLMQRSRVGYWELPSLYAAFVEAGAREVFFQGVGTTAPDLLAAGRQLASIGTRVVVKLPATEPGFRASAQLVTEGVPVLVTAVYSTSQALLAAGVGAAYIAPYLGRMADAGDDAIAAVARMQAALAGSSTEVLAASIRETSVLDALVDAGIDAVTVSPEIAFQMVGDARTAEAAAQFEAAASDLPVGGSSRTPRRRESKG